MTNDCESCRRYGSGVLALMRIGSKLAYEGLRPSAYQALANYSSAYARARAQIIERQSMKGAEKVVLELLKLGHRAEMIRIQDEKGGDHDLL